MEQAKLNDNSRRLFVANPCAALLQFTQSTGIGSDRSGAHALLTCSEAQRSGVNWDRLGRSMNCSSAAQGFDS